MTTLIKDRIKFLRTLAEETPASSYRSDKLKDTARLLEKQAKIIDMMAGELTTPDMKRHLIDGYFVMMEQLPEQK